MKRLIISLFLVLSISTVSCSGSDKNAIKDSDKTPIKTVGGSVTLQPLFYSETADGPRGGTSDITLELRETDSEDIRVAISDDEVQGSGSQWEAAAWNAMAVSTLVTGASLDNRELEVDATGFIDGPSAGALLTVGTISLILGDDIDEDVTMTGTINPDGTIGPVGGIQYKLDGAARAGKEIVLIPTGQINEPDENGDRVDLEEIGDDLGIEVKEVDNIYDAYEEFTGKKLARFKEGGNPELSKEQRKGLSKVVRSYQRDFVSLSQNLPPLNEQTQGLSSWVEDAQALYDESKDLEERDKPAIALSRIREAYSELRAVEQIVNYYTAYETQGQTAAEQVLADADSDFWDEFDGFAKTLEDYKPENLGHAANLVDSYGTTFVAVGLEQIAADQIQEDEQGYDPYFVSIYMQSGLVALEMQEDIFDEFSDVKGPSVGEGVDPATVANFFRKGADANIASFRTTIIDELKEVSQVDEAQAEALLKRADPAVALVLNAQEVERGAEELFGNIDNIAYAQLGAAVELYARSSELIAGYYSLGVPAVEEGQIYISDFRSVKAFREAKSLAKQQLAGVGTTLADKGVDPIFVSYAYEVASYDDSTSDPESAIYSLRVYWKGFVAGRVLTYLGGFPLAGMKI